QFIDWPSFKLCQIHGQSPNSSFEIFGKKGVKVVTQGRPEFGPTTSKRSFRVWRMKYASIAAHGLGFTTGSQILGCRGSWTARKDLYGSSIPSGSRYMQAREARKSSL